jgi:hypothetical protein
VHPGGDLVQKDDRARSGGEIRTMGQVVSIDEFRRQRLDRQLKKRLKDAQGDLANARAAQGDLISELRHACWPTDEEERILKAMENVAHVMDVRLNQECTMPAQDTGQQFELSRFALND